MRLEGNEVLYFVAEKTKTNLYFYVDGSNKIFLNYINLNNSIAD